MKKLIRKNNIGQLFYNIHKNEFYIEFGNVQFTLHMEDYLVFERKLKEISNDMSVYNSSEKINIPVLNTGIKLILTAEQLISLRNLFGFKTANKMSFKMKINYSIN